MHEAGALVLPIMTFRSSFAAMMPPVTDREHPAPPALRTVHTIVLIEPVAVRTRPTCFTVKRIRFVCGLTLIP